MMDLTGSDLAQLLVAALGLPTPPVNPTPAQLAAYQATLAQQKVVWTTISNVLLTYINQNAELDIPALGILDGYGQACSGTSTTGKIK